MTDKDNILLVEDDPEIARILLDHLRREGYDVTWVSSGLESWEDSEMENISLSCW